MQRMLSDGPRRSLPTIAARWRRPDPSAARLARAPRRGSVERPINARLVRGTWLLVASRCSSPRSPSAGRSRSRRRAAAVVRPADGGRARARTGRDYPDRAPGSAGALGRRAGSEQLALYGFTAAGRPLRGDDPRPAATCELRNVVAVVPGRSPDAIVVMAHRDNSGRAGRERQRVRHGRADRARARVRAGGRSSAACRRSRRTRSSSSRPTAARSAPSARRASPSARRTGATRSRSSAWTRSAGAPRRGSCSPATPPRSPARSARRDRRRPRARADGREPRRAPAARVSCSTSASRSRSASRGRSSRAGVPAVTLTTGRTRRERGSVDDPLDASSGSAELGRAAQATDRLARRRASSSRRATTSYVYLGARIVRGWAIQLVLLAALLPFLVGAVDLFARCRRRRIALGAGGPEPAQPARLLGYAGFLVLVAARLGAFPDGEAAAAAARRRRDRPVARRARRARRAARWPAGSSRGSALIPRRPPAAEETLAGYAVALLALGLLALVVVATNPFALVFLLPSLYAWLWLPQVHVASRSRVRRCSCVGLAGPVLLVVVVRDALRARAWTRRGTCSRSSPSGSSRWVAVAIGARLARGRGAARGARGRPVRAVPGRARGAVRADRSGASSGVAAARTSSRSTRWRARAGGSEPRRRPAARPSPRGTRTSASAPAARTIMWDSWPVTGSSTPRRRRAGVARRTSSSRCGVAAQRRREAAALETRARVAAPLEREQRRPHEELERRPAPRPGCPGSPKTSVAPRTPKASGLPGLIATPQKTSSTPSSRQRSRARGRAGPTETPPEVTSTSASRPRSSARGGRPRRRPPASSRSTRHPRWRAPRRASARSTRRSGRARAARRAGAARSRC